MDKTALTYYRLCREAEDLGLPVSLNDPQSPRTVDGLREMVDKAMAEKAKV